MFSRTFHGPDGISKFVEDREIAPKKEIRSFSAIALTSVISKWYASCIILCLEKEKEPENWKNLHVGGVDGMSCQHMQVMMTNLLQKHREWQEERNPTLKHGSAERPAMYWASLDIKTAFDEAKPKYVAQNFGLTHNAWVADCGPLA